MMIQCIGCAHNGRVYVRMFVGTCVPTVFITPSVKKKSKIEYDIS